MTAAMQATYPIPYPVCSPSVGTPRPRLRRQTFGLNGSCLVLSRRAHDVECTVDRGSRGATLQRPMRLTGTCAVVESLLQGDSWFGRIWD